MIGQGRTGQAAALARNGASALAGGVRDALAERATRLRVRARHGGMRLRYGPAAPDPYSLIRVDPTDIRHLLTPRFYHKRLSGRGSYVVVGEWDRRHWSALTPFPSTTDLDFGTPTLARFDNYTLYRSIRNHFRQGIPWTETAIYRYRVDAARYGDEATVLRDLRATDDLYESIRRDGYRRQRALGEDGPGSASPAFDEVLVDVGRDGTLIFDDGRHRLSVAKVLGLDDIPVRVLVRHPEWQRIRTEVATASDESDLCPTAKRHLDHPDLAEFRPIGG